MRMPLLIVVIAAFLFSCHKDNTPPDLQLKTGPGYTYSDISVAPGGQFVVGMVCDKRADDLSVIYTEVAFDGANLTRLVSRIYLSPNEANHAERNITVTARNQPGTERWVFNVNDADGRISKKEIRITVQ